MLFVVRRSLPMLAAFVALSGSGSAPAQPGPELTLSAPGATTYLHRVDFVGRMAPAVRNARVRLLRGTTLVTTARVRPDGSYVFRVRLANPGPFHVAWFKARSKAVSVEIEPRLAAALSGSKVAGAPLRLSASLDPAAAGRIHVQVSRGGHVDFHRTYARSATVAIGTRRVGKVKVRITSVPRPGYRPVSKVVTAAVRAPDLSVGATGRSVADLARRLAELHYAVPSSPTTFDGDLMQSVYAFQKVQGLDRTGAVDARVWARLADPATPSPRYRQPADHIEVDKTHQVLYLVRDGKVALISPVSTAGIAGYYTPEGRFAIYRRVSGYDSSPLGTLLDPLYFTGGYAIHGNPSVPPYPASHGCVRVPNFVIYRLFSSEPQGETVYVYS